MPPLLSCPKLFYNTNKEGWQTVIQSDRRKPFIVGTSSYKISIVTFKKVWGSSDGDMDNDNGGDEDDANDDNDEDV